ncbi:MAG: peptidylprolyl isomerase [Planctomycetota bacterium]
MIRSLLRTAIALTVSVLLGQHAAAQTAATIDGQPVDVRPLEDWLLLERGELISNLFGQEYALRRRAAELGVSIEPDAAAAIVEEQIRLRIDNAFQGDRDAWRQELEQQAVTVAGYRASRELQVEFDLLSAAVTGVGRVVPEEKVVRDWEAAYGPGGIRARVRALQKAIELVTPAGGWPLEERRKALAEAQAAARAEIEGLMAEVRAGKRSFADVAFERSDHPSAKAGGQFDGFFEAAGWPKRFVDQITTTATGELTEILEGRGGVWIFQIVSRVETPLETVRAGLVADLQARGPEEDEIQGVLRPLFEATTIECSPQLLAGDLSDRSAPALVIDGEPISMEAYGRWLRRFEGQKLLPRFAERRALDALAAEHGIDPSPEAIARRVEANLAMTVELSFEGEYEAWVANLALNSRTLESWRREATGRARYELIAEDVIRLDRVITEDQVRSRWIDEYGRDGRSVDARFIAREVIAPPVEEGEDRRSYQRRLDAVKQAAFDELLEIAARVDDGEDFGSLARELSDDRESAVLGGESPGGFRLATWSASTRSAIENTEVGRLTEPQLEGTTVVLFEITGRKVTPFEDVAEELRAKIDAERIPVVELAAFRNVLTREMVFESFPPLFE